MKQKTTDEICKDCGTWLEPEFDKWNKREVLSIFGLGKEIIEGFGIKECRVCSCKNTFIEVIKKQEKEDD